MVSGRYLLDTHVVHWLVGEPQKVPRPIWEQIENAELLCVSAVTSYELSFKHSLGKLPQAAGILAHWETLLRELMAEQLPLTPAEMQRAGEMAWQHRDPFDRMLVAQAQVHGLQIVTKDRAIRGFAEANCAPWK